MKPRLALLLYALLALLTLTSRGPATAQTYDAATDFIPSNPNGVWSYGCTTGNGVLNLYDQHSVLFGSLDYLYSSLDLFPHVVHNPSANVVQTGTVDFQPGQLALHPCDTRYDGLSRYSVVRWTAPAGGVCSVSATFTAVDVDGGGTDVHVLKNGTALFDGAVGTYLSTQSYTAPQLNIRAGDTIDFVVGPGADLNQDNDTTGLTASITLKAASTLSSLNPGSANAGGPAFTLTIKGTDFSNTDSVHWAQGTSTTALSTTYVSATQLKASVPASLIASPGKAAITVVTSGGVASNSKTFTIKQTTLKLTSATLTRNSTGAYTATLTLKNIGYLSASNVSLTSASLGPASTSTTLPVSLGSMAAGATTSTSLSFPGSAGSSGTVVTLKVAGKFTGGTFSGSLKVTLP